MSSFILVSPVFSYDSDITSLKVVTFNIGVRHNYNDKHPGIGSPYPINTPEYFVWRDQRMDNLAKFITENDFDVVFLQQFYGIGNYDLPSLMQHLEERDSRIKYVFASSYVSSEPTNDTFQLMLTLSAYPFIEGSKQSHEIYHKRVVQTSIIKNTPIGTEIRLTNIHTHIDKVCSNMLGALGFARTLGFNNHILGGDLNHGLFNDKRAGGSCYDLEKSHLISEVDPYCLISPCLADLDYNIDWVFLLKDRGSKATSNLKIISSERFSGGNPYGISDVHTPSVAKIISTDFTYDPHDTNKDGMFDILDVIYLVKLIFNQ